MPNFSGEDAKCTVFSSSGMIDLSFLKCLHKICSVKVCALYWVDITGSNQQDFDIFWHTDSVEERLHDPEDSADSFVSDSFLADLPEWL